VGQEIKCDEVGRRRIQHKGKMIRVSKYHAMKAYGGSGGSTSVILKLNICSLY